MDISPAEIDDALVIEDDDISDDEDDDQDDVCHLNLLLVLSSIGIILLTIVIYLYHGLSSGSQR